MPLLILKDSSLDKQKEVYQGITSSQTTPEKIFIMNLRNIVLAHEHQYESMSNKINPFDTKAP